MEELTTLPREDRRAFGRAKVPVRKTVQGELHLPDDEPRAVYLHLVDVSEGGMGVHCPRQLPFDVEIRLVLPLEGFRTRARFLDCRCRVAWSTYLPGATWAHGLEILDPEPETRRTLAQILESFSAHGRRSRFRLDRVLPVAVREGAEGSWIERFATALTPEAVTVRLDRPPAEGRATVRLHLEFGLGTVLLSARPAVVDERPDGRFQVEYAFEGFQEAGLRAVEAYIDRCTGA